ncbi:SGNH/GDSL hydrolase family protein [Actinoplanes sp. NPDC004185]
MAHLSTEAMEAVERKADYVTILIGANDACQWLMISPQTFRAYLDDALQNLKQGRPRARVEIVSIPDLGKLWDIAHGNLMALMMWQLKECPSLMTNATSSAAADVRKRRSVAQHVNAYNRELAKACKRYGDRCHWDGGRAHRIKFALEMVALDYFHPSLSGQRELARTPLPKSWTSSVNRR